ncbi:MAG: MFS transporter [Chloroflexi bacterium]|nr:MFS transporter [Chloroflexota bacterium]
MLTRYRAFNPDAYKLFMLMTAVQSVALTTVFTINLVYQVRQVGLNPLQLVLVGTTLELTAFLMEIPTGVVADVYSRRLSVILGFVLLGIGFLVEGSLPLFEALLVAQVIMGLGYTFLSGASSAWLVDEIGAERAGGAFLRAAQVAQVASFMAIFVSVALASISLQVAIIAGGLMLLLLAGLLVLAMPERGFQRRQSDERETWRALFSTLREGVTLIRGGRVLMLIMLATIIHGAFSEGFDRLSVAHILANFNLPPLGQINEIAWFGIISAVSMPLSIGATEVLRRRLDLSDGRLVAKTLMLVYIVMIGSVLLFTLGESFALILLGLWLTQAARQVRNPLMEAWINLYVESDVRATVLSIQGQADALGQIAGGPAVGAVGLLSSVRAAISASSLLLLPILLVFRRTLQEDLAAKGKGD